ncbi:MAG TPA: STAS domain-containing protein [Bacteroidota bacterium]|jgi:anti-sigma B factor antagonist|nr:STAS domain-containing protein [Bacteroidota bacterium]
MRIVEKAKRQIAVLSLFGDPLGEPDALQLREKISGILQQQIRYVVLDLSEVRHINSAGLGGLISSMFSMLKAEGGLTLACPRKNVREVFRITNLDKVFTTCESVDEAVNSYQTHPA